MTTLLATLNKEFQALNGLLYVDPEDLDEEYLTSLFQKALLTHDFFYTYSDDGSVYNRGKLEASILDETVSRHKEALELIWITYCKAKEDR